MKLTTRCDIDVKFKENNFTVKGIYLFLSNLILIGMSYAVISKTHYAVDSYVAFFHSTASQPLYLGRIISSWIISFIYFLHINPVIHQRSFTLIFICVMAICVTLLMKRMSHYLKPMNLQKLILAELSILMSFINVFILEWYLFPEAMIVFAAGLFTMTIAVMLITREQKVKNLLIAFLFLFMTVNIYQINITLFTIFSLTFILLKNNFILNKKSIKESLFVFIEDIMAFLANLAVMRLLPYWGITPQNTRIMNNITVQSLVDRFLALFKQGQSLIWIHGSGFMPKDSMLLFACIAVAFLIFSIVKNKGTRHIKNIGYIVAVVIIDYAVVFLPHMLTSTVWMAPRTIVGIFAVLTCIFLIIIKLNINIKFSNVSIAIVTIFLLLNFYQIQDISMNFFATNKIDKEFVTIVNAKISEYESKNNIQVTKIAIQDDPSPFYGYYNSVSYISYDTNVRTFVISWARVDAINMYGGRNLKEVAMNENVYNQYFKGKDWSYFDPDQQMVFVGDTLYMISY